MDNRISAFLKANKNMTLCTARDNSPHCANCFYAFFPEKHLLVFKSDIHTLHIQNAQLNPRVAGTIIPDITKVGIIQGIQFAGIFIAPDTETDKELSRIYHKKFPFAIAMRSGIWAIKLIRVKMTDNTLGFGKKLSWEASGNINL